MVIVKSPLSSRRLGTAWVSEAAYSNRSRPQPVLAKQSVL